MLVPCRDARPWRARPAGRSVALQVRVAQRRLGVDMHPPQVARRAVGEGLATVQQGQVVGDHQVVAAPAVGVVRLWVVQAAAQAGEQFAALFRGDAVVVELGGVDEAGVALDRRFAETQDGEFAARVALDYRRRRAAAVVRRAALVPGRWRGARVPARYCRPVAGAAGVELKVVRPPSLSPGASTQWNTWNSGTVSRYMPSQCSGT
ncbi:Uncharacterised protein [Pseudomonas aeruginosa]|nr:Uncharacterised protein [Pseudomonas aeruginosa]